MNQDIVKKLLLTARRGICLHRNRETGLFDRILTCGENRKEHPKLLLTHSLISLLGVSRQKNHVALDFSTSLESVFRSVVQKSPSIREYALLTWLLARDGDDRLVRLLPTLRYLFDKRLPSVPTMEVSWFLTALS